MGTKLLLGFGGTVIQVVVHLIATGSEMLSRFGGTVIQAVVHPVLSTYPRYEVSEVR